MEQKFGKVERVRIPIDEQRGKPRGFAIVAFKTREAAQRAIEEMEVIIGFANLNIKEAYQSMGPRRGADVGDKRDFGLLGRGGRDFGRDGGRDGGF